MEDVNNGSQFTQGFVMTPCRLERRSREAIENPSVVCTALNGNGTTARRTFSGDFAGYVAFGFPPLLEADMGNASALALIEAYAEMNSSPTLGGEQLATMGQTIGMLRSPFSSATKFARKIWKSLEKRKRQAHRDYAKDVRVLRKKKASKAEIARRSARLAESLAKIAADTRLEFRYGVMPLLFDCEAHIDFVAQKLRTVQGHNVMRVARSKRKTGEKSEDYSGPVEIRLDHVGQPSASMTRSVSVQITAGVAYRCEAMSNVDQVMSHLGLRLRDVPITGLALIPLSFVVDWAYNVENWLQAILPVPGIQPLGNWVTTLTRSSTSVSSVKFQTTLGWGTNHLVDVTFPGANEEIFIYERTVDNSLASHPLRIGKPISNTHLGDAAALSVNQFIGMVKRFL